MYVRVRVRVCAYVHVYVCMDTSTKMCALGCIELLLRVHMCCEVRTQKDRQAERGREMWSCLVDGMLVFVVDAGDSCSQDAARAAQGRTTGQEGAEGPQIPGRF